MRRIVLSAAMGVAMAFAALVLPGQASAHGWNLWQTSPYTSGHAVIFDGHQKIRACDDRVDGRRVRAWYWTTGGRDNYRTTAWAPSGGCTEAIQVIPWYLQEVRVCTEDIGCTSWRWA